MERSYPMGMCPCGKCDVPEMTLQCVCCGIPLTVDFTQTQPIDQMLGERARSKWGTARFVSGMRLRLTALALGKSLTVSPDGTEIVIGRRDPETGDAPQIDLEPFEAWRRGVSRRHALLRWREGRSLLLVDLGSSNGTFLNGQRLTPHEERIVRDSDEIRVGQLGMWTTFESDGSAAVNSAISADLESNIDTQAFPFTASDRS